MTTFTRTSPTSGGEVPTGVTEVGGIVLDLIGLNGSRVVSQLAASSLYVGYYDGGTPTEYQGNPGTIGIQSGFTPDLLASLGGGLSEVAVRVTLFDGDTAQFDFDDSENDLLLNDIALGNFTPVDTEETSSDGLQSISTGNGFGNDILKTGWFYSNSVTVLSDIFSSLTSGNVVFGLADFDPFDNFFDFTQGVDGGLINVGQPPNISPIANDDLVSTNKGISLTINVGANDTDPDGSITEFTLDTAPTNGTAVFGSGGSLVYTPNANFVGTETFTYTITDNDGASDTATVEVVVNDTANPGPSLPNCPVVTRAGTQDGSPTANQTLTGPAGANTFFVSVTADSGKDTITNFGKVDVFVTDAKLLDGNNDGLIGFGGNKLLDLDAGHNGGDDTVAFTGLNPELGLRYLGESCTGVFVYADAIVRPKGAIESSLADDLLKGDVGDASGQVFFFDTALQIDLGSDEIQNFGMKDLLVTTTKIFDNNNDGRIGFGSDMTLDLSGGGGEVVFTSNALANLEFDGSQVNNGVEYFVYSRLGSAMTGLDDLIVA